jgi:elongation factor Ts
MITSEMVKDLREKTGAGVMDCKRALTETQGDFDKALIFLREKGLASAAKRVGRVALQGMVESYIHLHGKIGVLVEINCESDFVARTEEFRALARDVAMHICASSPQYIKREEVPSEIVNRERDILRQQALGEGKPEKVFEKIVEGRLEKFFSEVCLLDQLFIRDQEKTIDQLIKEHIAKFGENIEIRRFARFQLGETI